MSTFRIYGLPPNKTPVATLRARGSDTALNPTYTGTAVSGRLTVYQFDIGARANGEYEIDLTNPLGNFVLKVATSGNTVGSDWSEIDNKTEHDATQAAIASLSSTGVTVTSYSPVAASGQIESPIIIGDDYLETNGRAFSWDVPEISGGDASTCSCWLGAKNTKNTDAFLIEGSITDLGTDYWRLSFELPKAETEDISEGFYKWSVELRNGSNQEITRVYSDCPVKLIAKQT